MKKFLAPILLLTLMFTTTAQGQSLNDWVEKSKGLLCQTTGVGCPESLDYRDLVERSGVYFKKRTDIPFTGKTTGDDHGLIKAGKKVGPWVSYWDNGQLLAKGTFKAGMKDGPWLHYWDNGQLWKKGSLKAGKKEGPWVGYRSNGTVDRRWTGTFKNGVKVQ